MARRNEFTGIVEMRGSDKTAAAFSSVDRSINRTMNLMKTLAGAAAIGAVVHRAQDAAKAFDNIAKTADKIGVSTDALQELRHAAEESGVEVGRFDKVMADFVRRSGEAAQGTGEAKDAYERLGIAVRDQQGNIRSGQDLLAEVADKFTGVKDQAERAELAYRLFGRSGVDITNMLRGGSKALDGWAREARDAGIVVEEGTLRSAERLNDELALQQKIIDTQLKQAFINLADPIADATGLMADLAKVTGEAFDTAKKLWANMSPEAGELRRLEGEIGILTTQIENSEIAQRNAVAAGKLLTGQFEEEEKRIRRLRAELTGLITTREKLLKSMVGQFGTEDLLGKPTDTGGGIDVDEERRKAREKAEVEAHQRAIDRAGERFDAFREMQFGEIGIIRQRTQTEHEILREALENKIIGIEEFNARRLQIEQDFHDQVRALEEERERRNRQWFELQRDIAIMNAADIVSTFGKHFKELYFLQQASAVTNTVMRTIESVQAALTVPPPAGYVFAAINAAAGAANVASIMATTFGSKSAKPNTGKGGGGGGRRAVTQELPPPVSTPRTPTVVNITLEGGRNRTYTFDEIRSLMDSMGEQIGDGYEINVRG